MGEVVPAEVWQRFTPPQIDGHRCQARTWNGGLGGQCRQKRMEGKDFCRSHFNQGTLACGRVNECPQYWKLQHFLSAERRREEASRRKPEEQRKAKENKRRKKDLPRWYTRHYMWYYASQVHGGVSCVEDLNAAEYEECLLEMDNYYRNNNKCGSTEAAKGAQWHWWCETKGRPSSRSVTRKRRHTTARVVGRCSSGT